MRSIAVPILMTLLILTRGASASESVATLRLALPGSADDFIREVALEFRKAVESRTDGAVKVDLTPQESSYQDNEIVSVISSGSIEMGGTPLSQFAYDVPLAGVFLQPFMFNFHALVRAAAKPDSEIRRLIDEEILYWTNTHVLWWQPSGANVFVAKGAPPDGASIADLPVGAPDDQSKELTRVCGGQAYPIPTAELSAALEEGRIRAAMTDILGVKTLDLWRVADTIVNTQHAPSLYLFAANDRVWQDLTPEQRRIITAVAAEIQARTWDQFMAVEEKAYALARRKGMTIYELSPRDVETWRACSSPLLEAYLERIGEPGQALFAAYGRLRTDPCCREAPPQTSSPR